MTPTPDHALILVDYQQGFDHPSWGRRNNPGAEQQAQRLLAHWRAHGAPVVIVRHDSTEENSTLRPDRPGNALKPGFEPRDGELLCAKQVHSAFIGTPLKDWLDARGVKDITISGISTDMCTSTTTRMGCDLGYRMVFVEDACVCFEQRDPQGETLAPELLHRAHITTLGSDFARVVRTEQVLA